MLSSSLAHSVLGFLKRPLGIIDANDNRGLAAAGPLQKCEIKVNCCLRALGAYFASLVHPSARDDVIGAARQQSFIAAHLLAGLLALSVLPLYLSLTGTPNAARRGCLSLVS